MFKQQLLAIFAVLLGSVSQANPTKGKNFDHVMIVIFENANYADVMKQPFFAQLAAQSANLTNFLAITHPSQGNYIALTSGSLNGVTGDGVTDVNSTNIVDLLEAHGLTWKVYAEDYPGNCFTGGSFGNYVRKHNPLISYINIQQNPTRCSQIVNANEFDADVHSGNLPNYFMYIPNLKNDGHDTGVKYANNWYANWAAKYFNDSAFMSNTVVLSTFDESGAGPRNQIYTNLYGPTVRAGAVSQSLNTYSLLRLVEENWNLGNLGRADATAAPISKIWNDP